MWLHNKYYLSSKRCFFPQNWTSVIAAQELNLAAWPRQELLDGVAHTVQVA